MTLASPDVADVLHGYEEIGSFLRISADSAKHRTLEGTLPTFKLGRLVCARKSSLLAWMAAAEARGLHKGRGRTEHEAEPERAA